MEMTTALSPRSTGLDLRLRRTALGVSQTAVAGRMGVSRPRVSQVEAMYRPPRSIVTRYLAALEEAAAER